MTAQLVHSRFMDMAADTFRVHTCSILKKTPGVADGIGQYSGEIWAVDQADIACTFSYLQDAMRFARSRGTIVEDTLIVVLPSTVTIAAGGEYRVSTTQAGFVGTYEVVKVRGEIAGNKIATLEAVP